MEDVVTQPINDLVSDIVYNAKGSNVITTIINGNIRKIDKTNLTYIEPNRLIVKGITFLIFNYSNEVFIENLSNKIKLCDLEDYLKSC